MSILERVFIKILACYALVRIWLDYASWMYVKSMGYPFLFTSMLLMIGVIFGWYICRLIKITFVETKRFLKK